MAPDVDYLGIVRDQVFALCPPEGPFPSDDEGLHAFGLAPDALQKLFWKLCDMFDVDGAALAATYPRRNGGRRAIIAQSLQFLAPFSARAERLRAALDVVMDDGSITSFSATFRERRHVPSPHVLHTFFPRYTKGRAIALLTLTGPFALTATFAVIELMVATGFSARPPMGNTPAAEMLAHPSTYLLICLAASAFVALLFTAPGAFALWRDSRRRNY